MHALLRRQGWYVSYSAASLVRFFPQTLLHPCPLQFTTDYDSTRLQSITQERDLDEFLNTATLAGTNFTAGYSLSLFCYLSPINLSSFQKGVMSKSSLLQPTHNKIHTFYRRRKKRLLSASKARTNSGYASRVDLHGQRR